MKKDRLTSWMIMVAILLLATYLRTYRLDVIPNGLMVDEAMRGYDAYSLAKTGADSFGVRFPLFLRSFDDYVAALYSYLNVPLMATLGLSVFSLRLSSAIMGILSVALTYHIVRRPFGHTAALTGSFLLAISSWHILASRAGVEYILMSFGIILTMVLAYRGLARPYTLIVAGIVAGISLYGYSPIKAFLPILLVGFVAFYWRELYQQKWATVLALLAFTLIAIPIFAFSLSPKGMLRFNVVYEGTNTSLLEILPRLIKNYFLFFSPHFLFSINFTGIDNRPLAAIALNRLQSVGLLYWFELPLILLGLVKVFRLRHKHAWFMLYWLIVAPIGVNLHHSSPAPYLFLTAIPVPHALAGAGFAWLLYLAKHSPTGMPLFRFRGMRPVIMGTLALISLGLLLHFGIMVYDLFYRFPIYGGKAWFYGRGPSVIEMESLKHQFDEVILASEDLTSSMFLLFYTRYDPATRQAEIAENPELTWQNIADYNIGNVRNFIQKPGCHLILTSIADAEDLKLHGASLITVRRFDLPDGEPVYGLYALPVPSSNKIELGAIFGDEIVLQGFAPVSPMDPAAELRPGQAICLIAQWQALSSIETDYTVFVQLIGPPNPTTDSPLWAQHDSPPAYGNRKTSSWHAGDVVQDAHILMTPQDLPPGRYRIEMGLYNSLTGERLPTHLDNGQIADKVILIELTVP